MSKDVEDRLSKGDLIICVREPRRGGRHGEKGVVKSISNKSVKFFSINAIKGFPNYTGVMYKRRPHSKSNWLSRSSRDILGYPVSIYDLHDWKYDSSGIRDEYDRQDLLDKEDEILNSSTDKRVKLYLKYHRSRYCETNFSYRIWKTTEDQLDEEELKIYKEMKNQLDL